MRRALVLVVLAAGLLLGACSVYRQAGIYPNPASGGPNYNHVDECMRAGGQIRLNNGICIGP